MENAEALAERVVELSETLTIEVEDGDTAGALETITRIEGRLRDLRGELQDEPQTADVAEENQPV
jgi:hypothetical protein